MKARVLTPLAIALVLVTALALGSSAQGFILAPPVVVAISPAANSLDASPRTPVQVVFDQTMDDAAVSNATFVIRSSQRGTLSGGYLVGGGAVTFLPAEPLNWGDLVFATATTGLLSIGGEPPAEPIVWQFQTKAYNGTAEFTLNGQSFPELRTHDVALGDLDGDGDLDAFAGHSDAPNYVWFNDGAGVYYDSGQRLGNTFTEAVAVGDMDGDGDLDAFVANRGPTLPDQVWFNDGSGNFTESGQLLGNEHSSDVVLGDLDGDGDLDAIVGSFWTAPNRVWLNEGDGTFTQNGQLPNDDNSRKLVLGDLDLDGDLDVISGNLGILSKIYKNNGDAVFSDFSSSEWEVSGLALGDLDGDGDLDAFVGKYDQDHVWFNDGQGVFTVSVQPIASNHTSGVALGDFDADGDLDAYSAGVYPDLVWINNGAGYFTPGATVGLDSYSSEVAIGDLDNDGDLDAFIANGIAVGPDEVWLNRSRPLPCWPCWRPVEGRPVLR